MSEQNKAVLKKWINAFQGGKEAALAILDEVITPDYAMHDPSGDLSGREAIREFLGSLYDGMPDYRVILDDMVAEGDRVAYRFTIRGTHERELMGFPPTGRVVEAEVHSIARIVDGKVAEEWQAWDFHGFLNQLASVEVASVAQTD